MKKLAPALSGLAAAGGALAVAELVAAWVRPASSPVLTVGNTVVDAVPHWLKQLAVDLFYTWDKAVLLGTIYLIIALYAAGVGLLAQRKLGYGLAGIALFGVVGVLAAASRPDAGQLDALPAVFGALAGAGILAYLVKRQPAEDGAGRRRFLWLAGGVAAGSVVGFTAARLIAAAGSVGTRARETLTLPRPAAPLPALDGVDLKLPGLSPFYTANRDFYRIDTALSVPQLDPKTWKLRIHGQVDHPTELTYQQLLDLGTVERDLTLNCVSNEVGGDLIGTARWLGVPLAPILRAAGIRAGADQLVSRSSDGWTCGTPTEVVLDGRDALLAIGMNGEPLPVEHGFPVRMLVPGLYGYVSACKWITEIEVTTFAKYDAYWVDRGWSAKGPVKTASRIDTPGRGRIKAGPVSVAGVAWAQHRGISKVEVQVDQGPWAEARLAGAPTSDTWRQWVHPWDATSGAHTLRVRATDGTGATQTSEQAPVAPDGATGWHEVNVTVS